MKNFRKVLSLFVTALLIASLCGCGGGGSSSPAPQPAPVSEGENKEADAAGAEAEDPAQAAQEDAAEAQQNAENTQEDAADAQQNAEGAQQEQPSQADEIAEQYSVADLPAEGLYTLFAVRNQGYTVRAQELAADSSVTLAEGGTGSMSIGEESMDITSWTLEDGTVTITMADESTASGALRGGVIELDIYGTGDPLLIYAQEAADTSGYELLTMAEVEERMAAAEAASQTRIGAVLAGMDNEEGVHLRYQLRLDELNAVQEFDVHAKGGVYYSERTTKVGAVEQTTVTFIEDGKVYNLYPDQMTGHYVTDLPLSVTNDNILLMDALYSEMRMSALRSDGAQEERELEGSVYSADVYPATDTQAEIAFFFTAEGDLAFCQKGAPLIEGAGVIGESFYTVEAIDSEADTSLFDISAYTTE